jgi:hypothetical protein
VVQNFSLKISGARSLEESAGPGRRDKAISRLRRPCAWLCSSSAGPNGPVVPAGHLPENCLGVCPTDSLEQRPNRQRRSRARERPVKRSSLRACLGGPENEARRAGMRSRARARTHSPSAVRPSVVWMVTRIEISEKLSALLGLPGVFENKRVPTNIWKRGLTKRAVWEVMHRFWCSESTAARSQPGKSGTSGSSTAISQFMSTLRHLRGWLFLDEKATRQFCLRCKAVLKPLWPFRSLIPLVVWPPSLRIAVRGSRIRR